MANILLGVTGSVAAIKIPEICGLLLEKSHKINLLCTSSSLYFFDQQHLKRQFPSISVTTDEMEWPMLETGGKYQRGDKVLHIELRKWADIFVVAPLDANTLAKFALGLADNCLTSVWRARNPQTPTILAPAMNTFMWEKPATASHLACLALEQGIHLDPHKSPSDLCEKIKKSQSNLKVLAPISKELACGDYGTGAMAELTTIVEAIQKVC